MAEKINKSCVEAEMEYREWHENPIWYCVKTVYSWAGKITADLVRDEKTGIPQVIYGDDKPADGVYETPSATIYFTYCRGYEEAKRLMAAATA